MDFQGKMFFLNYDYRRSDFLLFSRGVQGCGLFISLLSPVLRRVSKSYEYQIHSYSISKTFLNICKPWKFIFQQSTKSESVTILPQRFQDQVIFSRMFFIYSAIIRSPDGFWICLYRVCIVWSTRVFVFNVLGADL